MLPRHGHRDGRTLGTDMPSCMGTTGASRRRLLCRRSLFTRTSRARPSQTAHRPLRGCWLDRSPLEVWHIQRADADSLLLAFLWLLCSNTRQCTCYRLLFYACYLYTRLTRIYIHACLSLLVMLEYSITYSCALTHRLLFCVCHVYTRYHTRYRLLVYMLGMCIIDRSRMCIHSYLPVPVVLEHSTSYSCMDSHFHSCI